MAMMIRSQGETRAKCNDAFSLLVCETTEENTCPLSLLHMLREGDSGGERGRKEREMIAIGVSAVL